MDDGTSIRSYSYPYCFPFTPYTEVFPQLFPWANFSVDDDYYEEYDESFWREYHCVYDEEEHEWLVVGDTFEEYRKKYSEREINEILFNLVCGGEEDA